MAALHGTKGYITGHASMVNVVSWEADEVVDPYETTALASTQPNYKSFGFDAPAEINGVIECLADDTLVIPDSGTVVSLVLFHATARNFTGSAGITAIGGRVNRAEGQTVRYSFKGTGDWARL